MTAMLGLFSVQAGHGRDAFLVSIPRDLPYERFHEPDDAHVFLPFFRLRGPRQRPLTLHRPGHSQIADRSRDVVKKPSVLTINGPFLPFGRKRRSTRYR